MGQGRLEPSSVLAVKKLTSYAACHCPKHWDKTKCPTKTTSLVCNCEPKDMGVVCCRPLSEEVANHSSGGSYTLARSLVQIMLFKRTLSSEHVAVTEATCTLVHSRRKPVKPWHQDVNPTDDVHSTGLERRSSSTSLH